MSEEVKLTVNQQRFVEEYCSNGYNATQAAISAGYSENTARSQGQRLLTNVDIREAIKTRLDQLTLTAEELTKKTADIAKGNLADYMTTRMVEYRPRVKKGLRDIISELEFNLILQEEFCAEKGYTEEQYDDFQKSVVEPIQDKILKYSIELKHNPDAYRYVDGEPELIPQVEVDMPKLLADKERGIIKSFKYGKNGLEVELYPADAAMDRLMRVRGMFKDKLDITTKGESMNEKVSPEEAQRLLKQLSGGNFNIEEG
ncbi:terminase small subunit [Sphingobacterium sp. InxBP1]|uniref:terminase small subunit n=1 Tax=Sphingobacterium sp. InxBP1 TaxID=2870328 RepID=UPI0022448FF0|nr:terminase small subunit [Sphingobacterium sp. InxBP1]MCW8314199.1 terminase small subunit [Sphingobacterium sp. InxBP1]